MNNPEEQQEGSQFLDMMKKNYEKEQEEEIPNKFNQNFHQLDSESPNIINSDNTKNKTKQEIDPNYDDFLNAGGEKLISGLNKLNIGNISSNPNTSPKKPEMSNFFQNPMMNMNLGNKNNQKDLAFNYYFGNAMQNEQTKKENEKGGQSVPSEILEHFRFNQNIPNMDNDMNEPQYKNYFNNKVNDNHQNEDEKIEKEIYNNNNNMNQSEQEKRLLNMNFQNNNRQRMGLNINENILNQNNNKINNMNNMNNMNISKQMMQMNNNLNNINIGGGNIQFNNMDPRIRNLLQQQQQKIMQHNLMMGNNSLQMNPNQNQLIINNPNNIPQNQKNMNQNNNKNKKRKNKNKSNNNNNNNNLNIQNMNLIMNQQMQQQSKMLNYQNYNQFIHNQNFQNNNPMINYSSSQNQNQLNFNNNNRFIPNNINTLNNIQNYGMNMQQQKNFIPQKMQNEGYMQNNLSMQIMNNNINNNYHQLTLEQLISRANNTFPGKFFVIKSIDESNILSSIRFKIWCSTIKGNQKLQKAYKEADKKYPIILFFSVNGSGKFMGIALMNSDVENKVNFNYWSQSDKWKGFFLIEWICIKDVPNRMFRTIINDLNEGKPVTSSRDTQEIATAAGVKMLKVFKDYPQESTIFDSQTNEMKYIMQQQNEHNMGNIGNIGSMNNINSNMNNMGSMGNINNIGNLNNLGNLANNNYVNLTNNNIGNIGNNNNLANLGNNNLGNIGKMNNLNNINNMGNIGNVGNFNQMMKINPRNIEQNFGNNNIMNLNNINLKNNNLNINNNLNNPNNMGSIGGEMNNFGQLQMEINPQEKEEEQKEDIKNNMNEQYDFNNILHGKNDEDDEDDEDK